MTIHAGVFSASRPGTSRSGVLEIPLDVSVSLDESERLIITTALEKCGESAIAVVRYRPSGRTNF